MERQFTECAFTQLCLNAAHRAPTIRLMAVVRYHINVTGRVQGVGYRYFCQDAAASLSLTGWVRNQPNGSVELEIQGNGSEIESVCERLSEGPPLAHVAGLQKMKLPIKADEESFAITY